MPDIIGISETKLSTIMTICLFVIVFKIAYFMYKYCNKHFPKAFEGVSNKNSFLLSNKESCQTRSK